MGSHYSRHSLWLVTTGLDPVVHADSSLTNAGGSAAPAQLPHGLPGLRPAMTKGNERKRFGGETPTDAMSILPWLTATAAPASGRRTSIGVPPRFSSQGVFHRKGLSTRLSLPGTWRPVWLSVERALPAPTCPSPANAVAPRS